MSDFWFTPSFAILEVSNDPYQTLPIKFVLGDDLFLKIAYACTIDNGG